MSTETVPSGMKRDPELREACDAGERSPFPGFE
jgi:hypothetical protein